MDSVDLEVLRSCAEWLEAGHRVLLVTVVKTWGSSPRPEGAMLAVRDDGLVVRLGVGRLHRGRHRRARRAAKACSARAAKPSPTASRADEARRFGLPCGGTIQLVLEPLTRESGIRALLREIEAGHLVARTARPGDAAGRRCIRRARPTASRSTERR